MRDLDGARKAQYLEYLKAEMQAAAMHQAMADAEKNPDRSRVFDDLVQADIRHAARWAARLGLDKTVLEPTRTDLRIRVFRWAARIFGTERVVPWLVRAEAGNLDAYASDPEARDLASEERSQARVLTKMTGPVDDLAAMRAEEALLFGDGGSLRAAVLGINDGLVSNFSLVMGVAGGTGRADFVLLAGVAGLLAGAFSMAAGEYVSMRSQRDVYEHRIRMEEAEIREWPEEEQEELEVIYRAKGLSQDESRWIAKRIMERPDVALETMAREELGLNPSQLGSPWGAAASSFTAFVVGALVPILPYIFDAGGLAFTLSAALSAGALVTVGGLLTGLTGKNFAWGSIRMLLAGGSAAAVTFGIGHLIGISVSG